MDIECELPDRLCSQNLYFLDDEDAQQITDLNKKARSAPTKQKARRYLYWADSLVWRGHKNHLWKVVGFFPESIRIILVRGEYKRTAVTPIKNFKCISTTWLYLAGSDSLLSVWDTQLFDSIFLFKMSHLTQLLFDFICCFVASCIGQLILHCFSNQSQEPMQDTSTQCRKTR